MRRFGACTQKHDDVGVPQSLHGVALADEVSDSGLALLLDFEYLNSDSGLPPGRLVDYPIAAL